MSYLSYWKLKSNPFRSPQSFRDVLVEGPVDEALARFDFLVTQRKKLGLLVADPGMGKTVLLQQLVQSRLFLATNEHACLLRLMGQSIADISAQAIMQLDPDSPVAWGGEDETVRRIQDMIMSYRTVGHHTIMIYDDTSGLTESQLDWFGRLVHTPGLTTILSVNEEDLVNLPPWIFEHSDLRVTLPAWDLEMVVEYFDFCLMSAGGDADIFDGQSITRIQELAEGNPRKIAKIADLALVSGAVMNASQINAEIVEDVCGEFTLSLGGKIPVFWEGRQLNA